MCGRFSNAQPSYQYTATVQDQLQGDRGRNRGAADQSGGSSGQSSGGQSRGRTTGATQLPFIESSPSEDDYHPTYNVSPSSRVPVLRLDEPVPLPVDGQSGEKGGNRKQAMVIECMRWGLLPAHTTTIPRGPDVLRTINARDDSVLSGQSMWTPLLRKGKRCVVFCQGFYEWQKRPDGTRIAHFVGMLGSGKGRTDVNGKQKALMPMAGLYEHCTIEGQPMTSFTVITTESNKQLNFLHDRMPVILPDSQAILTWIGLRLASSREVCSLLKPFEKGDLDVYAVPREVGKVGNNDVSFILPVSARKDGIAAAFGRVEKSEKDANTETHAPAIERKTEKIAESKAKRKTDDDEELARVLQREEDEAEGKRARVGSENVKRESGETEALLGEEPTDGQDRICQPSSKFSPEPFNPPISPPRPNGGYSIGTTSATSPGPHSPRKSGTISRKLDEAAKGTKDIRQFFGSK